MRHVPQETDGGAFYLPIWEDSSEQCVWHASWLEVQPMLHAVLDVEFKVTLRASC
jgi:hypothetical protein